MKKVLAVPIFVAVLAIGAAAAQGVWRDEAALFDNDGRLMRPDPAGWPYISASIGGGAANMMAPEGQEEKQGEAKGDFHIIQINPWALDQYMETGSFPEGTVFTMTFYTLDQNGLPGDRYWAKAVSATEVSVKDSERFEEGWGFFRFEAGITTASAFPAARCQACHIAKAATDSVFTQLYSGLPKPE